MKGILRLRKINIKNDYEVDLSKYDGTEVEVLVECCNSYEIKTQDGSEYAVYKDELINAEEVKETETKPLKVVCITNDFRELQRYVTYKVLNEQQGFYEILNDKEKVEPYEKKYFEEVKNKI